MAKDCVPMIFFNIGWMAEYLGQTDVDIPKGGFKYLREKKTGHEQWNFEPIGDWLYGFAPIGKDRGINIVRLGAKSMDEYLEGVDVIFFARNRKDHKAYIIGWYRNATLYRKARKLPEGVAEGRLDYIAKTKASNGFCVPQDERDFHIPLYNEAEGGYGRVLWYGDKVEEGFQGQIHKKYEGKIPDFREQVREYISRFSTAERSIAASRQVDPEAKRLVEQSAVNAVSAHYQEQGFDVKSVEKDNCGWDLTVTHPNGTKLLIEVKGLSGQQISVQITPNEYKTLKEHYKKYILAVCTKALVSPELHIFEIRKQADGVFYACDDDGNTLEFVESVSAVAQRSQKKNSKS